MRPGSAGNYWRGRRVFVTGTTGFKGAWLALWLSRLGADVRGYALSPESDDALFTTARVDELCPTTLADLSDFETLRAAAHAFEPEVIFHLAAQPLVRRGYEQPLQTFATNVQGTCHVLEVARASARLRTLIVVTTDKCYRNREWDWGYREGDELGGSDPYSASKAAVELAVAAWRNSWLDGAGIAVATARAGNVVGGGDWAADRLIPDIVRAHRGGQELIVRYPDATRPWQHVIDCLDGYLRLAESLAEGREHAGAWNFGPSQRAEAAVREVIRLMVETMPARVRMEERQQPHEAGRLTLDATRAAKHLDWRPRLDLAQTIGWTADWYLRYLAGDDARAITLAELARWEQLAMPAQ